MGFPVILRELASRRIHTHGFCDSLRSRRMTGFAVRARGIIRGWVA